MPTEYRYRKNDGSLVRKTTLNDNDHLEIRDGSNSTIMDLEEHGARHADGGADPLPSDSISEQMIKRDTPVMEVAIPLVTEKQDVSDSTLQPLYGQHIWTPSSWKYDRIDKIYVELEWESANTGDIDLHNFTDDVKVKDLKDPTGATAKTIERIDVTDELKAITSAKVIGLKVAGDGTNAVTVYSAKLIVVFKIG